MEGSYPFAQVNLHLESGVRLLVRKIVPFTKYNYPRLRKKFELVKSMEHINLIKLQKVLEEEGRFHLIY
jgi:hypothetical protein